MLTRSRSRGRAFVSGRLFALFAFALMVACSREPSPKEAEHHYQMAGVVVSLDAKLQTATVKHGPIEGWMEAMTMEYPVASKSDFAKLHEGDKIAATVDVSGANYSLSNIQVLSGSR